MNRVSALLIFESLLGALVFSFRVGGWGLTLIRNYLLLFDGRVGGNATMRLQGREVLLLGPFTDLVFVSAVFGVVLAANGF